MSPPSALDSIARFYGDVTHVAAGLANAVDQFAIHASGEDLIAPAWLRYRVQGAPDLQSYLEAGRLGRQSIGLALDTIDKRLGDCARILDFGCGCGRTLRWMRDLVPAAALHGADIDAEAIDWCRRNFDFGSFETTSALPPLPYADDSFDLIYAVSVFTHLPLDAQLAWLAELRRVLAPGGVLLLTFLGYRPEKVKPGTAVPRLFGKRMLMRPTLDMWSLLEPADIHRLETTGMAYIPYDDTPGKDGYGVAYHRREFAEGLASQFLTMRAYLPDAFCGHLDVALLQKESVSA